MKHNLYIFILVVIFKFSAISYAQDFQIKSIGLGGGVFLPQKDWDAGFYIELNSDVGEVLDYIFCSPFIDYKRSIRSVENGQETSKLALQYLSFGSKFIGYLDSQPRGLYLGSDISFNIISSEAMQISSKYASQDVKTSNHTKIGISLIMGYLFQLKTVAFDIQSRYSFIQGGFNIFQLGLGFNYIL